MSGVVPTLSWSVVRSILSISVVTGLIWLFAEAQSVSEQVVDVRVTISPPEESDLIVTFEDAEWTGTVSVRIQGARAAIDEAAHKLAAGVSLLVGSESISAAPGRQLVELRTALAQNAQLGQAGVTVASVEPKTVEIRVDQLVKIDGVDIHPELPGVQAAGAVTVEPTQATIILPAALRDELTATGAPIALTATLQRSVFESLPEGVPQRREVKIAPPSELAGALNVRIEPPTATLLFTVRSTTDSYMAPSVPVWPMVPPTDFNTWDITIDPMLLHNVLLTGPSDVLDRVRSGEIRVIATVQLNSDELEQQIASKVPVFLGLPESVHVESTIEPVALKIIPRIRPAETQPPQE